MKPIIFLSISLLILVACDKDDNTDTGCPTPEGCLPVFLPGQDFALSISYDENRRIEKIDYVSHVTEQVVYSSEFTYDLDCRVTRMAMVKGGEEIERYLDVEYTSSSIISSHYTNSGEGFLFLTKRNIFYLLKEKFIKRNYLLREKF